MATTETWYTDANVSVTDTASTTTYMRNAWWIIKALLMQQITGVDIGPTGTAPASAAWTCVGSSDGSTAGLDGVDRWGTTYNASKLVAASQGVAHSWILLKSPNNISSDGPYYLLIDFNDGTSQGFGTISYGKSTYTGGTTTAAPTSTYATTVTTAAGIISSASLTIGGGFRVSVARTATGSFYILGIAVGSLPGIIFAVCALQGMATSDTWRTWAFLHASGVSTPVNTANRFIVGRTAATGTVQSNYIPSITQATSTFSLVNNFDGTSLALPFMSLGTATPLGFRGRFPDCYVISSGRTNADQVPSTGGVEYVHFFQMLFPFNVSVTL